MYMDYWESLTIGFMAVSAVDLRCVFGRSLVVFDRTTLLFSSVCGLKVFSYSVCSTKEGSSAMFNNISVFILV